ncbi:hypothetical protein [Streptomyces violascens]|uniref:hypothetical protein n=1 Tax=Streptomyces violascens TaxID=67381 RepID=UPI003699619E
MPDPALPCAPDPLAPFRLLLGEVTANAVENARAKHHTVAAAWTQAAHLLDRTIKQADRLHEQPPAGSVPRRTVDALADRYAAEAAACNRTAAASRIPELRPVVEGIAAGWAGAEWMLRHVLDDLDNSRTTPDNPPASGDTEVCCGCGNGPVTYQNYRDQLFCAHCSECDCGLPDGRCTVTTCPDCAARPGAEHADGCDIARCPTTGKQRLSCDQGDTCGGPLCRTRWIGRLPATVAARPDEDAAAHYILTTICQTNGYRPPPPGIRITADDLAEIDRMVEGGTPFGEAVSDVIRLANYRAQQADAVLDQRLNDTRNTDPGADVTDAQPDLRQQYAAEIGDEIYEYRERTMFWEEGGVTEEITRLAVRGAMTVRDAELEQLRAQLAALTEIARGYCPHCGRGDATPTTDQYLEQVRIANNADIILDRVRAIAADLRNDPDARHWANLLDTALDTPEHP